MENYNLRLILFLLIGIHVSAFAQVGIGTTTPDPSSILDISSSAKGLLAPRMTTAQRNAILNPAQGLVVYDTTVNAFFFHDGTTWIQSLSNKTQRDNYVLVKRESDFPAPSGGVINLDENTYYEVNGAITLHNSINLNNAYISGLDATEDILNFPGGTIFKGNTGGSIRNLTLQGAKAFNINGPGISSNSSLLLQNSILNGMTGSVGTISNMGLFFGNIVQFINNNSGLTYSNIGNLLLNNQAWLGNNLGTYETLSGNFGFIQKISGFSQVVPGGATGLDPTGITNITGAAVMQNVVFYGGGNYVKSTNTYTGYNFTNDWSVNCPGIPVENDDVATGNLYYTGSNVVVLGSASIKLPVTTSSTRNFRTSGPGSNRLVYNGSKTRSLNVFGAISFTAISGMRLTFSLYKNGSLVPGTEVVYDISDTNGRQGLSIQGTVMVSPGDYIEVYVNRTTASGTNQFLVTSYNLLVN